jgi:hypothetical protein
MGNGVVGIYESKSRTGSPSLLHLKKRKITMSNLKIGDRVKVYYTIPTRIPLEDFEDWEVDIEYGEVVEVFDDIVFLLIDKNESCNFLKKLKAHVKQCEKIDE